MMVENTDIVSQSQEQLARSLVIKVLKVPVEDRFDFLWLYLYALTSFDNHPKVVNYLYVESGFLDIVLELDFMEVVDHFLNLVKVGLITILIGIDQDIINITANKQI
jgi:hypothetical protein